jgi:hypothetical protein
VDNASDHPWPDDDSPIEETTDRPADEPPDTKWPTVIGAISIIYAALGLMCQAWAMVWIFLSEQLMAMGGLQIDMPPAIQAVGAASAVVTSIVGIILLVGGVKLSRRRRSGVTWVKRWVVLRMLLLLVGVAANFAIMPANLQLQESIIDATNQMQLDNGRPDLVQTFDEEAQWRKQVLFLGLFSGAAAIYPLFLGFYLSRKKIAEEVSQWM